MCTVALLILVGSIFSQVYGTVKLLKSAPGTAKFSVVDVTDGQTYEVTFPPKSRIKIGQTVYIYDKDGDEWNEAYNPDEYMLSYPEPTEGLYDTIKHALREKWCDYIRIGDKWAKRPDFVGKKKIKKKATPTNKLFKPATLTESSGKGKGSVVLQFTTLVPNEYVYAWQRNGQFQMVDDYTFNEKNSHKTQLIAGRSTRQYLQYYPINKHWRTETGFFHTNKIQQYINDRGSMYAALLVASDSKFLDEIAYPIVQARGGKTVIPSEPSSDLVLDKAYSELKAVGLRNTDMITKFWHPMLSQMPSGVDETYKDDVYWNKVRIDQLQDCTFAPGSEYAWLITDADPKYVRFLQEKKWESDFGQLKLLHEETQLQHFKFGHASMLLPEEHTKTNEFSIKTVHKGPKVDEYNNPIKYPYKVYDKPKSKLIRMAGSFRTEGTGKLYWISDDSGHFPVEGRLKVVTTQMKFKKSKNILTQEIKYSAHQIYSNLLRDFGYVEDEYDSEDEFSVPMYQVEPSSYNPLSTIMMLDVFVIFVIIICISVFVGLLLCGASTYMFYIKRKNDQSNLKDNEI